MKKFITLVVSALSVSGLVAQDPCIDGLAAGLYPCELVDQLRFMTIEQIGGGTGTNDIWGWTSPEGREIALIGKRNATAFLDISLPGQPVYLGDLPTETTNSTWRDIKVYGHYAFIVSEADGHGMQIFDLEHLLAPPSIPYTFEPDLVYDGFGSAHNIVINEESGYAYGVGTDTYSGGLHIVDITDPLNPVFAGSFEDEGYTHDAQVVNYIGPDPDHQGAEVAFNCNGADFVIADVTDKSDCQLIAMSEYEGAGYVHQGWLTEDQQYFLIGDETDEINQGFNTRTHIYDVTDLDNPTYMGYYEGTTAAIDHNQYVKGNFMFQSNYRSGLRILDVSDVENGNLYEVAYFDVYPEDDLPSFQGSWSNYCYFPSGVIVVTSTGTGVHVLQPNLIDVEPKFQSVSCQDTASFEIIIHPFLNGTFTVDQELLPEGVEVLGQSFEAPGSTTVVLSGLGNLPNGGMNWFNFLVTSEFGTYKVQAGIENEGIMPGQTTLSSPADESVVSDPTPLMEWFSDEDSFEYQIRCFTDEALTDLVFEETVASTIYNPSEDLESGTYYWMVRGINDCGFGPFSQVFSFTVEVVGLNELVRADFKLYPNPNQGIFTFESEMPLEWLEILDVQGKVVHREVSSASRIEIQADQLNPGYYQVRTGAGQKTTLVIK